MGVIRERFRKKTLRSYTLCKVEFQSVLRLHKVEFRLVFPTPSRKFTILAIHNVLAHGKSYEHSLAKKCYGHKLCAKSSFNRFFVYRLENSKVKSFLMYLHIGSRVSINFYAPSWKFKILAIPNVLGHGKSYEHGFEKKYDGRKLCAKSSFNQFFVDRLRNSKFKPFSMYLPL
ncbi:hypothetical protein B296_00017898 [Ensete ventricosum]|uniref:Uncharacterized protein n=1 Tax=Ensete ventricosum TaxID=4639 RepID=A0A427A5R5_ENSVE|nr:hypothetical protein B296_00017898 [Ensete ventricosum]